MPTSECGQLPSPARQIGPYTVVTRLDSHLPAHTPVPERRYIARSADGDRTVLLSTHLPSTDPQRFMAEAATSRYLLGPWVFPATELAACAAESAAELTTQLAAPAAESTTEHTAPATNPTPQLAAPARIQPHPLARPPLDPALSPSPSPSTAAPARADAARTRRSAGPDARGDARAGVDACGGLFGWCVACR
ncbi:hypothetical protein ACFWP5_37460 [Streptomyces sp. NPDC058469]|uniref:hypothetical protein n=1 Tax=Streptomyces sp. NPDC058469 TaxID=3346514 RepID=UPI0036626F2E